MDSLPRSKHKIYETYIRSAEWKKKRIEFIESNFNTDKDRQTTGYESAYYKCDRCGWNCPKDTLDVHHKHYRTLGKETRKDVMVVCKGECHKKSDMIRKSEGIQRSQEAWDNAGYIGWLCAKFGDDCDLSFYDTEQAYEAYLRFSDRHDGGW